MTPLRFGVDYAFDPHPTESQLVKHKPPVTFVVRYLANHHGGSKELTAREAKAHSDAGIDVAVVWETTAGRAGEGGRAGAADARAALAQAEQVGMPHGNPVYLAVDFDADPKLGSGVHRYFLAASNVLGKGRRGAYGGIKVIRWLFDHKLIDFGWQTYAWSGGEWDERAQLQQYANGMSIGRADVDYDRAKKPDFGQWKVGGHKPPPKPPSGAPHDPNSAPHRTLVITKPLTVGEDVGKLQHAVRRLSGEDHYDLPLISVDKRFGRQTLGNYKEIGARGVGYYLGLADKEIGQGQPLTKHAQTVIRATWRRTPIEQARGKARYIKRRRELKRQKANPGKKAANWLLRYDGHLESGSNTDRGGPIDTWEREAEMGHDAYCGAGCIAAYRHGAGIQLPLSWRYVPDAQTDIEQGWHAKRVPLTSARRGDLIIWDWNVNNSGDHIALYLDHGPGWVKTIDANTDGPGGEGIHVKVRNASLVLLVGRVGT